MSQIHPYRVYDAKTATVVFVGKWAKICRFLEKQNFDPRYHVWTSTLGATHA